MASTSAINPITSAPVAPQPIKTNKRKLEDEGKTTGNKRARQTNEDDEVAIQIRPYGRSWRFNKEMLMRESYTCRLLLTPNTKYDDDDSKDDVRVIKTRNGPKKIILNPERFSEVPIHTAWTLLCHGRGPSLLTFDPNGKYKVNGAFKQASESLFDEGRLQAAAQLFDLGLCLRSPKIQRAAAAWYEQTRTAVWSSEMVEYIENDRLGSDEKRKAYRLWLDELDRLDLVMMDARDDMIEAAKPEQFAVDIPEYSMLHGLSMERYLSSSEEWEVDEPEPLESSEESEEE